MKRQAICDLSYVKRYMKDKEDRCSSLPGVTEVRNEAENALAEKRNVTKQTVHRNLKLAAGVDKQGGADALDQFLHKRIWGNEN